MSRAPFVMAKATSAFDRNAEMYDTTIGWRFVNPEMKSAYGDDTMKLAMTQSPLSSSARKGDIGESPDARYEHKQPPGIWLHFLRLVVEADARRGDVKPVEIAPAEGAARRARNRHEGPRSPHALV